MSSPESTTFNVFSPEPPSTLSKESRVVWLAWGRMGNKEVCREAASKGQHVDLAIAFLDARSIPEAKSWFRREVISWANELLDRRQIFRASHILKNTKLEPESVFSEVMYTTSNRDLREYVGTHLLKSGKLKEDLKNLWAFLNLILDNIVLISRYKLVQENIKNLDQQTVEWKATVATVLFLHTENLTLTQFMTPEILWKHFLANRDLENLKLWINVQYTPNYKEVVDSNIGNLFKKFAITHEMFNSDLSVPLSVDDAICNEFSKFGVFRDVEKRNFLKILERLKNSLSIGNVCQILTKHSSVVQPEAFMTMLVDCCLDRKLFSILNACLSNADVASTRSIELDLICDFRLLVKKFGEESLKRNIFKVATLLAEDGNVEVFLRKNPIILLALIFFSESVDIVKVIEGKASFDFGGTKLDDCVVTSLTEKLPILSSICDHIILGAPKCTLNMYSLIQKHLKVKPSELFEFRFNNTEVPHFNSVELAGNYGYSKKLNYKFFLKQSRPSAAAKIFVLDQLVHNGRVEDYDLEMIKKKVHKLAVISYGNSDLTSSCVAFLEMLGVSSSRIRVELETAKILNESGYDREFVIGMLLDSEDKPYNLQNLLDGVVMELIDLNRSSTGAQIVAAFKTYEVLVNYSKIHSLKLPELLLKQCAANNMWLPFLIFSQIHGYPVEQTKLLIQFFRSPNMLEHIVHSVVNDIHIEDKNVLIRERDSRKYLLSKIGVRKSLEIMGHNLTHSITSMSSYESGVSSGGSSDSFEIDISNIKATLVQTLIRCHNSTDPPKALLQACQLYRNPLLAVFATAYEPDSIVTNWLTWLAVSCELCQTFTNYESITVSSILVTNLLEDCMKNRYPKALLQSLHIFIPENPLKIFVELLNECLELRVDSSWLKTTLEMFHESLKNCRQNSVLTEVDHEMNYLTNRNWIETTALYLLSAALDHNCPSLNDQKNIVQTLNDVSIWRYFSTECPNLSNLLKILECLLRSDSGIKLHISIMFKNSREEVLTCINSLLDKQFYSAALEIAKIENLPPDLILVQEWQNKFGYRDKERFWADCNRTFLVNNVTADYVVDFYMDCVERITDWLEKYTVLKMASEWAARFELSTQYELEKRMWLAFLYLEERYKVFERLDIAPATYLYMDLLEKLESVSEYEGELSKDSIRQFEAILNFALNKGNFWLALKLQKMFNCKSNDLETLKLSFSLAEGMISPYQMDSQQRLLVSNITYFKKHSQGYRKNLLSARTSGISSSSKSLSPSLNTASQPTEVIDSSTNDTLLMVKLLSEKLQNGLEIGANIFMTYRISLNIEIPYQSVIICADNKQMLRDALEDNCSNKLDVVHDFLMVHKWSKSEIADFICSELVNAATEYVNYTEQFMMWDLNVDQKFSSVLQFLQDNCSVLGYKIYAYGSAIFKSHIESFFTSSQKVVLAVELLIRAHDCFTTDCNMEGISIILKKSKEVISHLLTSQNWKLIVRLLTGVGRYTEMNYVFHILMENDQFEFLLIKGSKKDNTLKVALLEYLKKYCPDNRDLYKMVALHFTLFSEVAMLWEREAQGIIKNLISISKLEMQNNKMNPDDEPFVLFQNTDGTRLCVNKAMENYTHATQFHIQGEKLMRAMNSAKQAELLALQMALLNDVPPKGSTECLLNLNSSQINSLISSNLSFEQSFILTEAYNHHTEWAPVLYEQYVVKNNGTYFDSFLQHFPLTDTLANDISRKFISANVNTVNEIKCMKNVLKHLPLVHMKYRIASELGFTDLIEDSIASGELVYLKDTVWKKGYKS